MSDYNTRLTNPLISQGKVFLQKVTAAYSQLIKKCLVIYGTRKFITVFTMPATAPNHGPHEYNPQHPSLFPYNPFEYYQTIRI
jgi:hypothetical protein